MPSSKSTTSYGQVFSDARDASWETPIDIPVEAGLAINDTHNVMSLLTVITGMLGLFFKWRIFALLSAVFCAITFSNSRYSELDAKQVLSMVTIVGMGLAMAYIGPQSSLYK